MAARRVHSFEEKIQDIKNKIAKKQEELKNLRSQLTALEEKQNNSTMNEIVALMQAKSLSAETVLQWVRDYQPQPQS